MDNFLLDFLNTIGLDIHIFVQKPVTKATVPAKKPVPAKNGAVSSDSSDDSSDEDEVSICII